MRKEIIISIAIITFLCQYLIAQETLPNGGFEEWENVGNKKEEPIQWNSNRTGGGYAKLGPQTCFRESNNPHSGNYCLRLINESFLGTSINGSATTGKVEAPSTNASKGYIHTIIDHSSYHYAFTGKPDSLVGWFRFKQDGGDIGRVQAFLHDNYNFEVPDQGSSSLYLVAEATYNLPDGDTDEWTRFSVPFQYATGNTPDYILLIATSSGEIGDAHKNTTLYLDDLEVIYNPPTATTEVLLENVVLFPNPVENQIHINLNKSYPLIDVSIQDITNKIVYQKTYQNSKNFTIDMQEPAGLYFLTLKIGHQKVIKSFIKL